MRLQQSSSFLALLVLVFFFAVVSNEVSAIRINNNDKSKNRVITFEPIKDLSDPHIQELGKYSIDENNRLEKTSLKYDHLVSGKTRLVHATGIEATEYRFIINAIDGSVKKNYEAVLWDAKRAGKAERILFEFHEITEA